MAQVKLRFNNVRKERMLVERRLQVTKKKTVSGLSMKTLEGVISFVDADQVDKKVRPVTALTFSYSPFSDRSRPLTSLALDRSSRRAETANALDKVRQPRRRSPVSARRFPRHPPERHLLPPGRVQLASERAGGPQEEVRRHLRGKRVSPETGVAEYPGLHA